MILTASFLIGLSGCSMFAGENEANFKPVKRYCAEPRVNSSVKFHNRAKQYLSSYYKTRKENELFFAWYASEDSNYMAKTISRCWDKRNKHWYAVQNIHRKNRILQKLITQNMRLDSHSQVSELFLDDYRKIFVRDIQ